MTKETLINSIEFIPSSFVPDNDVNMSVAVVTRSIQYNMVIGIWLYFIDSETLLINHNSPIGYYK